MTDLVKRLREVGGMSDDGATRWYINPDGPEAADRIEKLEAANLKQSCIKVDDQMRIEKLEAALREIAGNGNATGCNPQIMCDIARKALDAE